MTDQNVTIESGDAILEGTLTLPESQSIQAAVLLIAGSGPLDRNQNTAHVQLNIFNHIADHLAENGIASLRYDKRGCGKSTGDYNTAGHYDLVDDAVMCKQFLQQHEQLSALPIFLLGHSEGSIISPQLIAKDNSLAGQILANPYLEGFEMMIRRQAEKSLADIATLPGFRGTIMRFFLWLSGDQLTKQKKLLERIKSEPKPTINIKKQVINAKWMREMITLNPAEIHGRVSKPTLAIGGEKDVQCLPGDVEKLRNHITGPLETHIVSDLTHILRRDHNEPTTLHYSHLAVSPVDKEFLSLITDWMKNQLNGNANDTTD